MPACRRWATVAVLLFATDPLLASPEVAVGADDPGLPEAAHAVDPGGRLVVEGLTLEGAPTPAALELERFEVWKPGAVVEVDGVARSAPRTAYFRGVARGHLDSIAVLTVSEAGVVDGVVRLDGDHWVLGKRRRATSLASRRADLSTLDKPFECGADLLEPPRDKAAATPLAPRSHTDEPFVATIAVETDYEYYALFLSEPDPVTAALDYLGLVIGYADVVYAREIDTSTVIGFARLWTGGASSDPWTATGGTSSALDQFLSYWNANMEDVARTAAHFFSGKDLGGGIAYLEVLCENYEFPGSAFDYGLSASLEGSFDWSGDSASNPATVVWDVYVVLHEIGHNFASPHTHDYCNIGGSSQPVDRCFSGCAGSGQGLPSCSSPPPHFDGGAGTIMSYCHLLTGGYSNISLTFGEGHTCGTLPHRVPDVMSAHVAARASLFPQCLEVTDPILTVQKGGSGSGTVTSDPAGIDCGSTCNALYTPGTVVELTAAPASGSTFTGWSGSGCSGTGTCTVTMTESRTVVAGFDDPNACAPDAFEPDNVCFGQSIGIGGSQVRTLCDEDWLWFFGAAGATYRIETSALTGGADTTLAVHHNCGFPLAFNDDFPGLGLASRIDWTPSESEFIDIRVRSFADFYGPTQGYTVSVTCIANCACPADLLLEGQTVSTTEAFLATQTITAGNGFSVVSPGDVTFHAGTRVVLQDGFSVGSDASFRAIAGTVPACSGSAPPARPLR